MEHFQPTWDHTYRIGDPDNGHASFAVEVRPGFGNSDLYMVSVARGGSGSTVQPEIRDWRKACALADHLYEVLLPEHLAERARIEERDRQWAAERAAQAPARKAAAAAHAKLVAAAPVVTAYQCPECDHLEGSPDEFEVPAYECSTCGTTGRGEDGRRCEQCHRFAAKAADHSCPSCDSALDEGPAAVQAKQLPDGDLVALDA